MDKELQKAINIIKELMPFCPMLHKKMASDFIEEAQNYLKKKVDKNDK